MNNIAKLIKSKTIPFIETLVKNYQYIDIDEIDVLIICKLYYEIDNGNKFFDPNNLKPQLKIDEENFNNHMISLMDKKYINLSIHNGKEEVDFDVLMDKLGELLGRDEQSENQKKDELFCMIVNYIESSFCKTLSSSELLIINDWMEMNYSYDNIKVAIMACVKNRKMNLNYATAILASKKVREEASDDEVDPEIQSILNSIYVKK